MSDTPSFWLVMCKWQRESDHGPFWDYEDTDDSATRGYFLTEEDAQAWVATERQRRIDEGTARNQEQLDRLNVTAEKRHNELLVRDEVRRTEYDALVAAGITPSFDRPTERGPYTPRTSKFDEQKYLQGQGIDWELVEIRAHVKEDAD